MTTPVWGIGSELTAAKLNLRPYSHAIQTVAQNITTWATGGWQALTFDADLYDPYNIHNTGVNPSRITPSVPGQYDCIGLFSIAGNTTNDRAAQFRKNGAQVSGAPYSGGPSVKSGANFATTVMAFATIACNGTTDYIELWVAQDSGATLATNVSATLTRSFMRVDWKGPL